MSRTLLPHFEACESAQLNPGRQPAASIKMKMGAERLGWKTMEVPRWFKYSDVLEPDGITKGKRRSMTETFIPSAQAAGCRLLPSLRARKLKRARAHWRVEAAQQDTPFTVDAEAVFVCCGAIETPALLRRIGIKKNIGNTLAFSPMIKVTAVFEDEVNGEFTDVPAQQVKEFSPRISMGCSISALPYSRPCDDRTSGCQDRPLASLASNEYLLRGNRRAQYRSCAQHSTFSGPAHPIFFERGGSTRSLHCPG
jgi:GMC oxidoreductase